jgi:hypothetical protein
MSAGAFAQEGFNVPKGPCGSAPPQKPQRRKGGESFPPLPLPATPLRRTEKKRPPSPPVLIAKIQFGEIATAQHDGEVFKYWDWNKDPGDVKVLTGLANRGLGINYTTRQGWLRMFEPDPAQVPIMYYTGSDEFTLTEPEVERLREFVRNGGTIWGDVCFGDPEFFQAFVREISRVLPGREWRQLPADHPLFHSYRHVEQVTYTHPVPDAPEKVGAPVFYGLDWGDRTAVILSRYDLSCGWDGHIRKGAHGVSPADARTLGINMIAYSLAVFPVGQYQSAAKVFYEDQERARGDFVFAQARLGGDWDTQPNAIANLLKFVTAGSATEVKFQRRAVELDAEELQTYPFLYITGRSGFELTEAEVAALRRYVRSGGFVLASSGCGRGEFDTAFRREIKRVLPESPLEELEAEHAVYSILHPVEQVQYSPYTLSTEGEPPALPLEGCQVGARTAVIYSRYDVGGGWRGFDHPFGRAVAHQDAVKLGVNIVLYAMTH